MGARRWRAPQRVGVYGDAPNPRAPGTWDREVWWALNRSARVGTAAGRHRWRNVPPFNYGSLRVTAGAPKRPYGVSTTGRLVHQPHTVLFAWRAGVLAGHMVAWHCSARTAYFEPLEERPAGRELCQMCVFLKRGRVAECEGVGDEAQGSPAAVPGDGQGAVPGRDRGPDAVGEDVRPGPG